MVTIIIHDGNEEVGRISDYPTDGIELARRIKNIYGFDCEIIQED